MVALTQWSFEGQRSVLWKVYSFFDCSATHQALGFIGAICDVGGCGSALGVGWGVTETRVCVFQAHLISRVQKQSEAQLGAH